MRINELLIEIRDLNLYSKEEWEEYISNFNEFANLPEYKYNDKYNDKYNKQDNIVQRIKSQLGSNQKVDLNISNISGKVIAPETLNDHIQKNKITLGIVSGCYDLMHLGHVRSMNYAKGFLEKHPNPKLCVLTLSDNNIRIKKGVERPILNINERLELICGIGCVDYVVPLEDPNCLSVLDMLKPKYFFKMNADRQQDIVRREMELVESYGGSVEIIPKRPQEQNKGISTTSAIHTVLEKLMREY
jgi:bifunctional ADP-heptose synthase (sugar kinase/adenylyltransferase)